MDKPTCKLCGQSHWPRDPHIWKDTVEVKEELKAGFDRAAYQREYMKNKYRPRKKIRDAAANARRTQPD